MMHPLSAMPAARETASSTTLRADTPSDDSLIERMAQRDEVAFGLLYDRWSGLVYNVVARIVDPADAEEILEDAFWQAWRQAARYSTDRGKVSTWLCTIARSRALDRRRALGRRSGTAEEGMASNSEDTEACSPLAAAIQTDEADRIRAAIECLPVEQRETVEMAYFEGMSQREIARTLGIPLGTIKTRARLAASKLRDRLAPLFDDPEPA